MKKTQIRDIITRIHFCLLGFVLLNFTLKNTIEISLNYRFAYLITILIYSSGIILFFWNFKPFKKKAIYFSIYIVTPILTLSFWIFGGIFFGLLASIVLYPVQPNKLAIEKGNISIYENTQGFLGRCCPYMITEKQYLIFEKKIKEINLYDRIDSDNSSIIMKYGKSELKVRIDSYEFLEPRTTKKDTIILIKAG